MNILFNLYVILVLRIAHIAGGVLWVVGAGFGLGAATVATWRARGHRGRHRAGLPSADTWTGSIEGEVGL